MPQAKSVARPGLEQKRHRRDTNAAWITILAQKLTELFCFDNVLVKSPADLEHAEYVGLAHEFL